MEVSARREREEADNAANERQARAQGRLLSAQMTLRLNLNMDLLRAGTHDRKAPDGVLLCDARGIPEG